MPDENRNEEGNDFVVELRVRIPKGLLDLAERTLKDALAIAGDVAKIGRNVVSKGEGSDKPKLKKMDIK